MKPLFREIQRAPKALVVLASVVFGITMAVAAAIYLVTAADRPDVSAMEVAAMMFFTVVVPTGILVWLACVRQEVVIDAEGVHVQQHGLMWKRRSFAYTEISSIRVRPLNAFGEFGGWGIRYALNGTWGYILNGANALDMTMSNGRRYVVSVVNAEPALSVLEQHGF